MWSGGHVASRATYPPACHTDSGVAVQPSRKRRSRGHVVKTKSNFAAKKYRTLEALIDHSFT